MSPEKPTLGLVRAVQRDLGRGTTPDAGAAWNPFGGDRVRPGVRRWVSAPASPGQPMADLVGTCLDAALRTPVGFIVGPHGSGKSTLLRNIVAEATDRGLDVVFLHPGGSLSPARDLARRDLVTTDAAGRSRPLWWGRLLARCRRAGTPLLGTARREWVGRTLHRRRVTPEEAAAVVAACLEGTGVAPPSTAVIAERLRRAGGSVRLVLRSLSDDWELGVPLADGWPGRR